MIRTLIVEESGVGRLGIRSLLAAHPHILDIDEAASGAEMMAKLRERYYEFVIVEPALTGASGIALLKQLRTHSPWSDVLVYTKLDELTFGVDAIRNGARGYLMKNTSRDEFSAAVKRVGSGKVYLSRLLAEEFANGLRKYDTRKKPHEAFSKREFQVFSMAVCRMTLVESAHILHIRAETVRKLKQSMMDKLGASTQAELVEYASAQGLTMECRAACSLLWEARFGPDYVASPDTRKSMFFA
jgi:DNA-binding NarL/FixJ family response regulator